MSENCRNHSRKEWIVTAAVPSESQVNMGSLQRIADATELMAKRYSELIRERDDALAARKRAFERENALARRITSMKGVITKLKKARKEPVL